MPATSESVDRRYFKAKFFNTIRRISAVQDTFVVARKKTSQVTMLEVVVGGLISAFPEPLDFDIEQD
jgi:hypothetical protein